MPTRSEVPVVAGGMDACCSPLTGGALDEAAARQLAHVFHALGDPTRVRLVSLIAAAPGCEACICDLVEPVGLSQPTVSYHMRVLVDAGVVTRDQRGKWAYFALVPDTFTALQRAVSFDVPAALA